MKGFENDKHGDRYIAVSRAADSISVSFAFLNLVSGEGSVSMRVSHILGEGIRASSSR